MDIILIIWASVMGIAVLFAMIEWFVSTKLKDTNRFKKWWRKKVIGIWSSNHPRV